MKLSSIFSRGLIFVALFVLMLSSVAFAGNPGSNEIIIEGPEYWGVLVADCNQGIATLRVKKIEECDVVTESKAISAVAFPCPSSPEAVLSNPLLENITLFGDTRTPVITKVKNHTNEPGTQIYSMDVQIKFIKQ